MTNATNNRTNQGPRLDPRRWNLLSREGEPVLYRSSLFIDQVDDQGNILVNNRNFAEAVTVFQAWAKGYEAVLATQPEALITNVSLADTMGHIVVQIGQQASEVGTATFNIDLMNDPKVILKLIEEGTLVPVYTEPARVNGVLAQRLTGHIRASQKNRAAWRAWRSSSVAPTQAEVEADI